MHIEAQEVSWLLTSWKEQSSLRLQDERGCGTLCVSESTPMARRVARVKAPVASVHRDGPHGPGVVQDEFSFSAVCEYQLLSLRCGEYKTSESL